MTSVLPDYDTDRVYPSDIKKLVQWYNLLQKAGIINKDAFVKAEEETTVTDAEVVEETKAEKKLLKKQLLKQKNQQLQKLKRLLLLNLRKIYAKKTRIRKSQYFPRFHKFSQVTCV
jgi:hypothetical protein